jgi:tetratricopeptide (TPR) repeat protein
VCLLLKRNLCCPQNGPFLAQYLSYNSFMVRSLNWKLLLWTLAALTLAVVAVSWMHGVQIRRSIDVFLGNADRAREAAAEAAKTGNRGKEAEYLNQAVTYYQHYLSVNPEDIAVLTKFALILDQKADNQNDWRKVAARFEEILQRDPSVQEVRERLFLRDVQLSKIPEALVQMQALLAQSNSDPAKRADWEHKLGWCLEATGDYPKAVEAFARATLLEPARLESYVIWAEVMQNRLKKPDEAANVMDAMVKANSQSFRAYLSRAKYLRMQKLSVQAEADIKKALELAPREPDVYMAAADWAHAHGDWSQARAWLRKGWEINPGNLELIRRLTWLDLWAGNSTEAEEILTSALKEQPGAYDLRFLMAELLQEQRRNAQAEAVWLKISQDLPDDLNSRFALFECALRANQLDKARALISEIRDLEGEAGKYGQFCEAELLIQEGGGNPGELDKARKSLEQLAVQEKTWSRIPLLRAQIEEQEGNQDKAVAFYLQALELGERRPGPSIRLVRLLLHFQRYLDAEKVLFRLKDQMVASWELRRLEAELNLANQNMRAAERLAAQAVPAGSSEYRDALWLGRIYHGAGADQKAEAAFRQAVALAPQTPDTWIALTQQLTRMGRRDEAQIVAQDALTKVAPRVALFTDARCCDVMGLVDRAEALYKQALTQNPDDFSFLTHGADFFRHVDQPEKAEPFLWALLKLTGTAPADYLARARRNLAAILAAKKSKNSLNALALIDENLRLRPNQPVDVRARAFVMATEMPAQRLAIEVFENTARRQPLSLDEPFQLAQLYEAVGDSSRAQEQVSTLLTIQPDNPQWLAFQIRLLLQQADINQARTRLRKLELLEPDSPRTRMLKKEVERA